MNVFITGGTGYMGRHVIPELLRRRHTITALARAGSESKLPSGCVVVTGNALNSHTYARAVPPAGTFVHLVGVSHPSPGKAREFRDIDLASALAAVDAAKIAGISHFIYVSVAHPAPVMRQYIAIRQEAEAAIRESGMNATILRPWYVLGPAHRWPYVLVPFYWLLERVPATQQSARRLGLVTISQMAAALSHVVENPAKGYSVLDVPQIRTLGELPP